MVGRRRKAGIAPGALADEQIEGGEAAHESGDSTGDLPPKGDTERSFTLDSEADYIGPEAEVPIELTASTVPIAADMAVAKTSVEAFVGNVMLALQVPAQHFDHKERLIRKVEVSLTPPQRVMVYRIFDALHGGHFKAANGRHIDKKSHVFQWMLDQLILADETAKASSVPETAEKQ